MGNYKKYEGENSTFVNPYNFVNVDFSREPKRERIDDVIGQHSGVINCRLVAKTPLAVPDNSNDTTGHKEHTFMRTPNGVPMIPGSSLRGTIRSLFETVTNSCFLTTDEKGIITYRTKVAFEPGLLNVDSDGNYHLYEAKRYVFIVEGYRKYTKDNCFSISKENLKNNYHTGDKVYFSNIKGEKFITSKNHKTKSGFVKTLSKKPEDGLREGVVCIGEHFSRKHFESIFERGKEVEVYNLKKSINKLRETINIYNDSTVNKNAKNTIYYAGRDYFKLKPEEYMPVWYKLENNSNTTANVYLSPANIGRTAYVKQMGDKLYNHRSCKYKKELCPACQLFGMAQDSEALGSRVRFSDALLVDGNGEKEVKKSVGQKVVLKELSSPKPSYLPFYLNNSGGEWSYDNEGCKIRGRKFYWHNLKKDFWKEPNGNKTERNSSMELMPEGSEFRFSVYFDRIDESELNRLLWTLTIGDNSAESKMCHKIGHGKPMGLGSVKISIDSVEERVYEEGKYSISELPEEKYAKVSENCFDDNDKEILEQMKIILYMDSCNNYTVDYPGVVDVNGNKSYDGKNNTLAAHQWFTNNFSLGSSPQKVLPNIRERCDKNNILYYIMEAGANNINASENKNGEKTIIVKNICMDKKDKTKMTFVMDNRKRVFGIPSGEGIKNGDKIKVKMQENGHANFLELIKENNPNE